MFTLRFAGFALLTGCSATAPDVTSTLSPGSAGETRDAGIGIDMADRPGDDGDGTAMPAQDAAICESLGVAARPIAPDMLIVLDRSLSMANPGASGFPRWLPSVQGVKSVAAQLDETIRFGLMLFPGNEDEDCSPGEVKVAIDLNQGDAIATVLDDTSPAGGTPTAPSLTRAGEALRYDANTPDQVARNKYVLLVTDGAPTCKADPANGITSGPDEANTYAAISALAADDILTYVVGYETRDSPHEATLDEMARRGGTGDTAHRPVEDEASLVAELERIARTAVSCNYALESPPGDPAYVRVQIDGESQPFGDDGWALSDAQTVSLQGRACASLRDGKPHTLKITVECEPVIVR